MNDKRILIDRKEVMATCSVSHQMLYKLMAEGRFPRPLKVGSQAVRWYREEVMDWIGRQPRTKPQGKNAKSPTPEAA